MADKEFANYDSHDYKVFPMPRLAKDAEVRETANGQMVRLTVVSTSRNEGKNGIVATWWEINVADFHADAAAYFKKGDILVEIKGHDYQRRWGDDDAKVSMCLDRAEVKIPPDLFAKLKERGWSPGKKDGKKESAPKKGRKQVQELPED